jgi:hypothetical protein
LQQRAISDIKPISAFVLSRRGPLSRRLFLCHTIRQPRLKLRKAMANKGMRGAPLDGNPRENRGEKIPERRWRFHPFQRLFCNLRASRLFCIHGNERTGQAAARRAPLDPRRQGAAGTVRGPRRRARARARAGEDLHVAANLDSAARSRRASQPQHNLPPFRERTGLWPRELYREVRDQALRQR